MAYQNNGYRLAVLAALLGAGGLFVACSSDSNPTPPVTNADGGATGSGGSTGTGGSKAGGAPGTGGAVGGAGGAVGGAGGAVGGAGGAVGGAGGAGTGGAPVACTEDTATACLECPVIATTDVEFLNHCGPGTSGCIKFTGTVPATLPPIP